MSEVVGEGVVRIRAEDEVDYDAQGRKAGTGYAKGFSGTVKSIGAGILAGIAVDKIVGFTRTAISGASDLNETISKTNVLFGSGANEVVSWSKDAATSLGQTQQQALDAASTFAIFGKSAGLQGKELTGFSKNLTGLATDLASFNNTSPEEAIDAIGAALRGEAEPIRKYGVLLDDASLRQEALRQGLVKTTSEALTPQQKVLATQALLFKQTTAAQGDFQRTSGGLANQQRILAAQVSGLATSFGQLLLPVVLVIVKALNNFVVPALQNIGPLFGAIRDRISEAFGGGGAGSTITEFASTIAANLLPALRSAGDTFTGTILPAVLSFAGFIRANVLPVIAQMADIFVNQVIPVIGQVAQFIYGQLIPAVAQIVVSVGQRLAPVFQAIFEVISTQVVPAISRAVEVFRTQLLPVLQPIISKVVTFIGWLLKLAASILGTVLPPILKLAGFILSKIIPAIAQVIVIVAKVINTLLNWGAAIGRAGAAIGRFGGMILGIVKGALTSFFNAVASLPGRLLSLGGKFLSAGKSIITSFVNGLKNAGGVVSGIVGNVWDALRGLINGAIDRINSALSFTIHLPGPDISVNPPDIPHLQSGTRSWQGGLARVGEVGPETVLLPTGARVLTAAQTRQAGGMIDYDALALAIVTALTQVSEKMRPVQFVLPTGDPEAAAEAVLNRLSGV